MRSLHPSLASVHGCGQACFLQPPLPWALRRPVWEITDLSSEAPVSHPDPKGGENLAAPLGGRVGPTQNALNFNFTERFV